MLSHRFPGSGLTALFALVGLGVAHSQAQVQAQTPAPTPTPTPTQVERLPSKIDLGPEFLKLGIVSRTQGDRDTCSLFAITAIADYEYARANPGLRVRLSEEFLAWAANEAAGLQGDQAMFYEAVHGLNTLGICATNLMPYEKTANTGRRPSEKALVDAVRRGGMWKVEWIKRWNVNRPLTDGELLAIKKALANGHPVACGLRWPKAPRGASLLEVPPPGEVYDGHSIVFTGYNDQADGRNGGGVLSFRNSSGPRWGRSGYGVMSYAYARSYANDALWLQAGAAGSERPSERFEAETMTVLGREKCSTTRQSMRDWGGGMWSGGEQLFCRAEAGGSVELGLQVRKTGRYRPRILATAAPDFGVIRVTLDGTTVRPDFDLYSGRVCPAGGLELAEQELSAGNHTLRLSVVGKNPSSEGFYFGIDAVDLLSPK